MPERRPGGGFIVKNGFGGWAGLFQARRLLLWRGARTDFFCRMRSEALQRGPFEMRDGAA